MSRVWLNLMMHDRTRCGYRFKQLNYSFLFHLNKMCTTPDTASLEIKQRNVAVVQISASDDYYDLMFVANHIYRSEVFTDSGDSTEDKEKSYTFVEYKDETYSFNVLPIYQMSLMKEVPRYISDVHCIVFVVAVEDLDPDDGEKAHINRFFKCFKEDAQSISLLVITDCDRLMSQEEKIKKGKSLCGQYQMKKGILPVCFADDDFHLSGPMKIIRQRKIKEDEDRLHSILCTQCDIPVVAKNLTHPGVDRKLLNISVAHHVFLDTKGFKRSRYIVFDCMCVCMHVYTVSQVHKKV